MNYYTNNTNTSNNDILFKSNDLVNNLIKYYSYNYSGAIILFLCSFLISFNTDKQYIKGLISLFITSFTTWIGHYLLHLYPNNSISELHLWAHHSDFARTSVGKLFEYLVNEIFFFGGGLLWLFILLLHKITGKYLLNPYIIMFWTLSVPIVHELYYHQSSRRENIHKLHHMDNLKSLGPDIWDIIFETKHNNTIIEDETAISIIMLTWCFIYIFFISLMTSKKN